MVGERLFPLFPSLTYTGVGTNVALDSFNLGTVLNTRDQSWAPSLECPPVLRTWVAHTQDFTCLDRGITDEFEECSYLLQLPLAGQAMVMAYNIPALGPSDPSIVLPPPKHPIQ